MFASLPFLELRGLELDVGMLYLLSVTALLSMGVLTGGWGAGRARLWGRVRALVDLLVCQLPALCALLAVVLATGSLRVRDIVAAQSGAGAELGLPWAWNALRSPHLFLLFSLFFMTALVDGSRSAEPGATTAKQAGSAGFFFAEWMHLFVMCALGAILFLGGYGLPFVSPADLSVSTVWKVLGATLFLVKCWALLGLVLVLRAALPRLRPDTVLRLGVSLVLPSCTVALALAFLASRFPLLPEVERSLGLLTLFMVAGVAALLVGTVLTAPASSLGARFRARTNPLL